MNRNVWATIAATVAVAAVVILGFREMGSPGTQRLRQADRRRVQALAEISQQVNNTWQKDGKTLPKDLEQVAAAKKKDPVSGKAFAYHVKSGSEYEVCATFVMDDRDGAEAGNVGDSWLHPKGDYCFQMNAAQPVPQAPYY
jgi:hypothetical protein